MKDEGFREGEGAYFDGLIGGVSERWGVVVNGLAWYGYLGVLSRKPGRFAGSASGGVEHDITRAAHHGVRRVGQLAKQRSRSSLLLSGSGVHSASIGGLRAA